MLRDLRDLKPVVKYIRPVAVTSATLVSLSDASHGHGNNPYGQIGVICGVHFLTMFEDVPVLNPLYWTSAKRRRVTYSSFGAEILASADAEDRKYDMKL